MLHNKIKYLFLILVTSILAILYNEYSMGILFLVVIMIPFVLFGILSYAYSMISVRLVSGVHIAKKGEMIPITILLDNPTIFPISNITIYLNYENAFGKRRYKKDISAFVDRKSNTSVVFNLSSEYTGNLVITLKRIRIYDYMKIFSLRRKLSDKIEVAILPNVQIITDFNSLNQDKSLVDSEYYSPFKSGDDPSEVFAIREYREGDRPQRIHWKLSMKLEQLMIKEFSEPWDYSAHIFLNLRIPDIKDILVYMDALLETALSLSSTFQMNGLIHYFSWYDYEHKTCRRVRISEEKDLYEAMDGLLHSRNYSEGIDILSAYTAEHPNEHCSDLFYITGEVVDTNFDTMMTIRTKNKHIIYVKEVQERWTEYDKEAQTEDSEEKIINYMNELGINLSLVDIDDLKNNIEQLKLV